MPPLANTSLLVWATMASLHVLMSLVEASNDTSPQSEEESEESELVAAKIHGSLMYVSMGLLLPIGILVVRQMRAALRSNAPTRIVQALFYVHVAFQVTGTTVLTIAVVYSFRKFGYDFEHTHQRLGLALILLVWLQPIIGLLRPKRGVRVIRPIWYGIHWLFGTGTIILGIYNLYSGIKIYEHKSEKSIRTLNIIFSIQIAVMAFIYFAQDRWDYCKEQGNKAHDGNKYERDHIPLPIVTTPFTQSPMPLLNTN